MKVKIIFATLFPIILFAQGIYLDEGKSGFILGRSYQKDLQYDIESETTSLGISFGRKLDLSYGYLKISSSEEDIPDSKTNLFALTVYPESIIPDSNSVIGVRVQYGKEIKSKKDNVMLSGGFLLRAESRFAKYVSVQIIVSLSVNAVTSNMDDYFFSVGFGMPLKIGDSDTFCILIEPALSLNENSKSYGLAAGFLWAF